MALRRTKKIANITMIFAIVFSTVSPSFSFLGNYANAQEDVVGGFALTGNDNAIPVDNIIVDPSAASQIIVDPILDVSSTVVDASSSITTDTANPIVYSLNAESTSTNGGGGSSGVISGPIVNNNIVVQQSTDSAPMVGGVSEQEYNALKSFYNATGGDSWTNHTNWLDPNVPVSEWYGVYVDNGSVLALNFDNNNLDGSIPSQIGEMVNLETINFSNNYLSGEIPKEIGFLIKLKLLILSNNKLNGFVPAEIGNIPQLESLMLNNNKLAGFFPTSIAALPNLSELFIYENNFTGIPNFSGPNYLNNISVQNNSLTFEDLEMNIIKLNNLYGGYSPQAPIKVDSNEITLTVGDPLFLTVDVGGTANKYDWFKNGILVSSASNSPNYVKDKISASDFGLYTCQIKNDIVSGLTLTSEQIDVKSSVSLAPLAKVPGYSIVAPIDEINLNSSTPYKVTIDPGENSTSSAITYAIHLLIISNSAPYNINSDLGYIQEDGSWGMNPVWLTYEQMGSSSGKIMKNLVGNTSYSLTTIARNSDGVETNVLYPTAFSLVWVVPAQAIKVSNITTSSVTVNWKAGGGTEHEFHIYQADYSGETSLTDLTTISIVSTTTEYSYIISGLTPSTTYNENSYFVNSQDFVYMSYASVPTFKTISLDAITTTALSVPVVAPVINTTNGGGSGYQAPAFITPLVGKFSAVINDSATETNSTTVKLVLNGGLAARMAISNSADFSGISQESYQTTKMWTLLSGSGQKTIFIKFFDQNGSVSPVVTATIKLTTGQVLGVKITHLDELITKLKYRQNGKQVNELQNELKKRGFFSKRFRTTNYYGPLTVAAVKKYKASK